MRAAALGEQVNCLAALLRREHVPWSAFGLTADQFVSLCVEEDLTGLVQRSIAGWAPQADWPAELCEHVAREVRADAVSELLRQREMMAVLEALANSDIHPVLLKGTPFAYAIYDAPCLRPRNDTDLLIRREQVDTARRVMVGLCYRASTLCDGELLFCQFEMAKTDPFGVRHAVDFHWKISTQSVFADVLRYDELDAEAIPVPSLGLHARTTGLLHALLLACLHPAMHHRNIERLIWVYDIHLLASRLSTADFDRFTDLAMEKQVAAIVAHELSRARSRFGTRVPNRVTARLAAAELRESSAMYLRPGRRWHDELISTARGLPRWRHRAQLLREVVFPDAPYMLRAYGLSAGAVGMALLPALYVHRITYGAWKVLIGRK